VRFAGPFLAASLLLVAGRAAADDLEDYQRARNAYDTGDWALAVERLQELLQREPTPSRAIREESLQYLGASLLFLERVSEADAAFEQLLVLDPEWELDSAAFPTPILDEFARIKAQMRDRLAVLQAAAQQAAEAERLRRLEEYQRRRAALAEALAPRYLARTEEDRTLFLAFVPFGVGQFQNGQDTAGWAFFGVEAGLALANAWTFLAWDWYTREWNEADRADAPARAAQAADYARGYKIASWTVLGTLLATMAAGVIHALVFYEEPRTEWMLIPLEEVPEEYLLPVRDPDEFLPPPDESVPADAGPAPAIGFDLRLRF
jgi:hypothetical protein